MEEKAILGVPWTVLSFGANKVVTTVTTLVLARLLVPADFGIVAITQIVLSFLFWFGGLSFASTIVLRQDLDRRGLGTALTMMLISGVAVMGIADAASPAVAAFFSNSKVEGALLVLSGLFVFTGLTSFYDSMLQRELEFRRRFVSLMSNTASNMVVSIALAVAGAGYWSLIIGSVASSAIYAVVLVAISPVRIRPAFDRTQAGSLLRTGRGFLAQGITVFIRQNADNVTVGRVFGIASLGFYSMAYRLGDLSYWAISDPVARVTFPAFARSRARGEDIRPTFLRVLRLVALAGCPAGVLLSAAAGPFTRTFLGAQWVPMIGVLGVLGIWSALRPIDTTLFWLLNSIGRADLVAWLSLFILVPLIPGFIVAVSIGHLEAVGVVVVIDTLISVAVLAGFVQRHAQIGLRSLWRAVAPIGIASVPAWVAARLTGDAIGTSIPLAALIGAVGAGVVVYAAVIALVDRPLLGQAFESVKAVLGRRSTEVPAAG